MADQLPIEVEHQTLADGVRYVLPKRDLGKLRWIGLIGVVFGLLTASFGVGWIAMTGPEGMKELGEGKSSGWFLIAFAAVGLLPLIPGLGFVIAGLAVLTNRTYAEIIIRGDRLWSNDRLGVFRWKRKRNVDDIEKLFVVGATDGFVNGRITRGQGGIPGVDPDLACIGATGSGMKPLPIALGYHKDLLNPLVARLAESLDGTDPAKLFEADEQPRVKVVPAPAPGAEATDDEDADEYADELLEPPVDARSIVEQRDDGVTITVPPAGFFKGSKGLGTFAVIWNGFLLLIFGFFALGAMGIIEVESEGDGEGWIVVLFALVFFGVGVGMALAAWNMGRRRAIIDIVGDVLVVTRQSVFGTKQDEFAADQIGSVIVGPSGMEVNDEPVMQLQIHPRGGKTLGMLTQLDDEELEWLAATIRKHLGRKITETSYEEAAPDAERDADGLPVQPTDSRIAVDRTGGVTAIAVPPQGVMKHLVMLGMGTVFFLIGAGAFIGFLWSALSDGFDWSDLFGMCFLTVWSTLFGGAGLAMLIGGVVYAKRRFLIEVERDRMTLHRRGPFGAKTFQWSAAEISSIRVADSGTKIGNRSLMQLQITPATGKAIKLATGRDEHELAWLAAELIHTLGLSPAKQDSATEPVDAA